MKSSCSISRFGSMASMEDGISWKTCVVLERTWTSTTYAWNSVSLQSTLSFTSPLCINYVCYPNSCFCKYSTMANPLDQEARDAVVMQYNTQFSEITCERWLWSEPQFIKSSLGWAYIPRYTLVLGLRPHPTLKPIVQHEAFQDSTANVPKK